MKVILYMAISANGYIAKRDDNTDWVCNTDWTVFSQLIKDIGCIVMGRRTYEHSGNDFSYQGALNIVVTTNKTLVSHSPQVIFTSISPQEVIQLAHKQGHRQLLIVGGGQLNEAFLTAKLIDEIYLSVHPLILGNGINLFNETNTDLNLSIISVKQLTEDLVQLHYRVNK